MIKIILKIEVDFDESLWGLNDEDSRDGFVNSVLGGDFLLHSIDTGDDLGIAKIIDHPITIYNI